jgi:hypothetical protein
MSPSSIRRAGACIAFALVALTGCVDEQSVTGPPAGVTPQAAVGDVLIVTNTNDAGPGSLRQAIADAGSGGTIQFEPSLAGQTISLASTLTVQNSTLIIEGPQSGGIVLDGGGQVRVLHLSFTEVTDVTLRNVTVSGGNGSTGGGILNSATLRLENSTVRDNEAHPVSLFGGLGGGVYNSGDLTVVNSTVSANSAEAGGGGLYHDGPSLTLINTTIAFNAGGTGGGVYMAMVPGEVTMRNSIVAANTGATAAMNCLVTSAVTYEGLNISDDASCGSGAGVLVADPVLGPLADNGGPTATHALAQTSPAIDAATACNVTIDQRYIARPQGAACDVGAVEFDDYSIITIVVDGSVNVNPKNGVAVVTGSVTCSTTESFDLELDLTQNQKARRAPAVVQASASTPVTCDASPQYWSAAMAPSNGSFQNGSATATVASANTAVWVKPSTVTKAVKLFWGHK